MMRISFRRGFWLISLSAFVLLIFLCYMCSDWFCFVAQCKAAENLRQSLKTAALEDGKKSELMTAIHAHFREWLQGTPLTPFICSFSLFLWYNSGTYCVADALQRLVTSAKLMICKHRTQKWRAWSRFAHINFTVCSFYRPMQFEPSCVTCAVYVA